MADRKGKVHDAASAYAEGCSILSESTYRTQNSHTDVSIAGVSMSSCTDRLTAFSTPRLRVLDNSFKT